MKVDRIMEKALNEYAQYLLLPKKEIKLPIVPLLEENQTAPLLYKLLNEDFSSKISRNQLALPNFKDCSTVSVLPITAEKQKIVNSLHIQLP